MTDRPSENLLSRLEQSLRQSRAARMHLAARLRELEAEADAVRAELAEMDTLATQSEAAIYRLLTSVLTSGNLSGNLANSLPSDAELEAAMRPQYPQTSRSAPSLSAPAVPRTRPTFDMDLRRQDIPTLRPTTEALTDRFVDRTIPQAVTLLLREEGGAARQRDLQSTAGRRLQVHWTESTISIAVSLNRNTCFARRHPELALMMRDTWHQDNAPRPRCRSEIFHCHLTSRICHLKRRPQANPRL